MRVRACVFVFALLGAACGRGDPIVLGVTSAGSGGMAGAAGVGGSSGVGASDGGSPFDAGADADRTDATFTTDARTDDARVDDAGRDAAGDAEVGPCREVIADPPPRCSYQAQNSLAAARTQWRWPASDVSPVVVPTPALIPLVANFTDDNNDDAIDLCDTPDVVVVTIDYDTGESRLVLLSGDTGTAHFTFDQPVNPDVNPALADLDGDAVPEVVAIDVLGALIAFDHGGHTLWVGDAPAWLQTGAGGCHAIAIHDLEGDGDAEILAGFDAFDDTGRFLFGATAVTPPLPWPFPQQAPPCTVPAAADLDRDGTLEVLFGHEVYSARGESLWSLGSGFGYPHAINLDADRELEVVLAREDGIWVLEHDGQNTVPIQPCGMAPLALADTNADARAEVIDATCGLMPYSVSDTGFVATWDRSPAFLEATASAAAFDFGARGAANVIATETGALHVFDGASGTLAVSVGVGTFSNFTFPIVVDVDNDGSADVLTIDETADGYALVALSAIDRSWAPTRRIWNQVTYAVTNIDESSVLPRTDRIAQRTPMSSHHNALIEGGGICVMR